jgi:hypothetical protein
MDVINIGYYEENNYHTEILGTFIEPFLNEIKKGKINFTVYNSSDKSEWVNYYKTQYNFTLKTNEEIIKDIDKLDKIIIGTSINVKFLELLDEKKKNLIQDKIYYICHLQEDLSKTEESKTIVLTPLNKKKLNQYVLPINNCYNLALNKKKLIIGLIGRFKDDNRDINDLINLIKINSKYDFCVYIFSRHLKFIPKQILELQKEYPQHLQILLKKNTEYLIKMFKDIKFICPLSNKNSIYYKDRLTGLIPISYNFNIPCLIENDLGEIYNINNCIRYKISLCEIFDKIFNISDKEYANLIENLKKEKEDIVKNNNKILESLIR